MVKLVEKNKIAPKTINNARTWLSVALGEAVRRKLLPQNPCEWVKPLPDPGWRARDRARGHGA